MWIQRTLYVRIWNSKLTTDNIVADGDYFVDGTAKDEMKNDIIKKLKAWLSIALLNNIRNKTSNQQIYIDFIEMLDFQYKLKCSSLYYIDDYGRSVRHIRLILRQIKRKKEVEVT